MQFTSSKLASWIAIFSLIFSTVLTMSHNHRQGCGCSGESHVHSTADVVKGLENLPKGDCLCTDCGSVPQHKHQHQGDHDKDSCSICRMVYEHANQTVEFVFLEFDQPVFDFVALPVSSSVPGVVSDYLTRGPPALNA